MRNSKAIELSVLAQRILQNLVALYRVNLQVAEGEMIYQIKQHDPEITRLYRFPHEFDAALNELAQAKYIEKHPGFPFWTMLKFPGKKEDVR